MAGRRARPAHRGHRRRLLALTCPCGLPQSYDDCCGRCHTGAAAPTAELLMRSRYSAFVVGDTSYLLRTWHPTTRPASIVLDPAQHWLRLVVLGTDRGGLLDTVGTVEFRATYELHGRPGAMGERSAFVREAGHWLYAGPG